MSVRRASTLIPTSTRRVVIESKLLRRSLRAAAAIAVLAATACNGGPTAPKTPAPIKPNADYINPHI